MRRLLPGLLLVAAATGLALLTASRVTVSALVVAIVLGVALRNTGALPEVARPGVVWAGRRLLRAGVVLLGLQLSVASVLALGGRGLAVIGVTVAVTFGATLLLGRVLRVPQAMTFLVATGFAICGAAAVAAMSAVVDPDGEHEDDTATAIALVTLYGTAALVLLPLLVPVLGLGDADAGLWIGASVHEVAQVVAAAGAVSAAALAVATVTKLGRVVLLAPLVAAVGAVRRNAAVPSGAAVPVAPAGPGGVAGPVARTPRPPVLPLFVAGFLLGVAVRSTGVLPDAVLDVGRLASTVLLTAAMVGLGTGVHLRGLLATGGRAAVLGAGSTLVAAVVSGVLVVTLG